MEEKQLFFIADRVNVIKLTREMEIKFLIDDIFIISEVIYKKGFIFYKIKKNKETIYDYIVSQSDIKKSDI
jgi:hypothetical protein